MQTINLTFFGNEKLATGVKSTGLILQTLIDDARFNIETLILNSDNTQYFKEIEKRAAVANIPIKKVTNNSEIHAVLKDTQSTVGVLASFGQIIDTTILELFPRGILNIHPSLLPKYRGSTPIETALLHGDSTTGVSIMKLVKEMDAGPILAQKPVHILDTMNKQDLHDILLETGIELLLSVLADPQVPERDQIGTATYSKLIRKSDGEINWHQTADKIMNHIRAYAGWPTSIASFHGIELKILSAIPSQVNSPVGTLVIHQKQLLVGCADGSLELKMVQPAGKKPMSAQAFINGYRSKLVF